MGRSVIYHTNHTPEQFAYLAGIIDGEGCFYIGRMRQRNWGSGWRWQALIKVTSCDESLIIWLENTFGGAKDSRYRWTKKEKFNRPIYNWQASGEMLDYILPRIKPYLIIKKQQCDAMERYRKTTKRYGNQRLSDEITQKRFEIMCEMRNLNSRFHNHSLKKPSALSP